MDDFELQDRLESLERQNLKLQQSLNNFIDGFDTRLQDQLASLIDCLSSAPLQGEHIQDKEDYIIKLLCNLGYGQNCILENQKMLLQLLGSRNVGIRNMSVEEKQRKVEKVLSELQNPYQKKGKNV